MIITMIVFTLFLLKGKIVMISDNYHDIVQLLLLMIIVNSKN